MTDRQFEIEKMYSVGKEWMETHTASPRFKRMEDFGGLLFEANNDAADLRRALYAVSPSATGGMFDEALTRLLGTFPSERSGLFDSPAPAEEVVNA